MISKSPKNTGTNGFAVLTVIVTCKPNLKKIKGEKP